MSTYFSAKKYHDIKKIEIIRKSKDTNTVVSVMDMTKAKANFFDSNHFAEIPKRGQAMDSKNNYDNLNINAVESNGTILDDKNETPMRFTETYDIIKFYQIMNYPQCIIKVIPEEDRTIRVTKEKFDDDLLEFITTCEELLLK
jgi:hypothetical protein